jgi:hypothetical protein
MDTRTKKLLEQSLRSSLYWYFVDCRSVQEEQETATLLDLTYIEHVAREITRELLAYFWIDAHLERHQTEAALTRKLHDLLFELFVTSRPESNPEQESSDCLDRPCREIVHSLLASHQIEPICERWMY